MSNMGNGLEGVNRSLYDWSIGYEYIHEILKNCQEAVVLLADIFGDNSEKREKASIEFYQFAWGYYPELGANPMIDILAEYEHDRAFYENYRDHTTHIIKTFLLGLYFYDQVEFIHNSIISALDTYENSEEAFFKAWTITALYHDMGYLFENNVIELYEDKWNLFKNKFNEMLKSPLSFIFDNKGITKEKERSFIKSNKIYMESIDSIGEIEAEGSGNGRIWEVLKSGGKDSGLSNDESINGIHSYYEFASKMKTLDGRQGYRDHGICSALLLGKVWYAYSDYLKLILNNDYDIQNLLPLNRDEITTLCQKQNEIEKLVEIAVNAIALHNINKEIWNVKDAISYKIILNDFRMNFSILPFSCLLRLCDELQLWDRVRFRKTNSTDEIVTGKDIELMVSENKIYLYFNSDSAFTDPQNYKDSKFKNLHDRLALYLDREELDKILICGKPEKGSKSKNKAKKMSANEETIDEMVSDFSNIKTDSEKEIEEDGKEQWLVGAVNLDEDVHFSSFYLRQSMEKNLPLELKEFGYHNIVSVYEDYNEIYYMLQRECVDVSNRLISYFLKNRNFWEELQQKILDRISILEKVFMDLPPKDGFCNLSDAQLLSYYEKHNLAHKDLYVYARIPEVLDRGVPTFTIYLKNYLRERSEELREEKKLNEVFDILTYPEMMGCSGENILEICELISLIKETSTEEEQQEWKSSNGRFLIRMKPEVVEKIEEFAKKWRFWGYHGYRDRALKDFSYFAEKVRLELTNKELKEEEAILISRQRQAASKRLQMFSRYDIDEKYQSLFYAYSRMGTIKLKRRYCQLKNFAYLDQLLFEIARRHNVSESVVRCMLPNELICFLKGDETVLKEAMAREKAKVFVYHLTDECEKIIYGSEAEAEAKKMKDLTDCDEIENGELFGETASLGTYRGVCKVLGKDNDKCFEVGEILVATDIDPDKFELLPLAGAVITETGGFTCHAAIVCRELQIPCIVGIHNLTKYIYTGQHLEVDADKGKIKIISSETKEIIHINNFETANISQNEIGNKAYSLLRLKKGGFSVPDFFCIPINALRNAFIKENSYSEQGTNSLIVDIQNMLNEMDNDWWAIRSSTNREDGDTLSGAGQEITMLRVHKSDIIQDLYRIIKGLKDYFGGGSLIIQKMVWGSYSGIIFTENPMGNSNELIIDAVPGGCEYLTSGQINPARYIYKKNLLQFDEVIGGVWKNLLSESLKEELKNQANEIASFFGNSQNIEWTASEKHIYFLQSRRITKGYNLGQINIFSAKKNLAIDTLSIYQAYALPIHLRDHMLRTAAIVCWIMDHWKGKKLNEKIMIEACLLHDIGNIVKGTNDKFKFIFPDVFQEDDWQYWLNIRKHIGEKYGKTDIEATLNIAREINVSDDVLKLIKDKQFSNNKESYQSDCFERKICAYADQRVSPNGILSLTGRIDEAKMRYRGISESSVNRPDYKSLKSYAEKIEKQIFALVNGKPEDINDKAVEKYIPGLKMYEF